MTDGSVLSPLAQSCREMKSAFAGTAFDSSVDAGEELPGGGVEDDLKGEDRLG